MIRIICLLMLPVLALIFSCHSAMSANGAATKSVAQPAETESIGSATMKDDGSIVLQLRAQSNGAIGDAVFVYRRGDPNYDSILKHIGPIKPGETKLVRPWPANGK
jgi:hypothetical protein